MTESDIEVAMIELLTGVPFSCTADGGQWNQSVTWRYQQIILGTAITADNHHLNEQAEIKQVMRNQLLT